MKSAADEMKVKLKFDEVFAKLCELEDALDHGLTEGLDGGNRITPQLVNRLWSDARFLHKELWTKCKKVPLELEQKLEQSWYAVNCKNFQLELAAFNAVWLQLQALDFLTAALQLLQLNSRLIQLKSLHASFLAEFGALPPLGERRWNDIAALFSVRAWADFVLQKLTTLQLDPANDKLMLELKAINQIYDANIMQRLALSERAPFVRDFCTESQSTLDADQLRKLKFLLVLLSCEADGSDPTVLHFIHFLDALSKNNLSANQLYYQELSQKQQCYLRLDKFITELQAGAVATANTKLVVTVSKSLIKTIFWLPIDDGYKLLETLLIDINNLTAEFGPEELYLTLYAVLAAQPAPGSMQSLAMVTRDRLQVGFIDEQRGMLVNVLHEVFTASYPETIFARRVSYKDLLMAAVRLGKLTILAKLLGRLKKLEDGAQFIAQVTDELVTGLATAELGFLFEGFAVTTESIAEMVDPGFLQQLICLQAKAISQSLYISEVDDNSLECVETLVKSVPLMRTFLHDQLYNGVRTKRLATTAADALQTEKEACKKLRVFSILAATRAVTLAEVLPAARDAAFDVKFCNTVANFFKQLFVADHLVATSNATAIYQGLGLDETITMQELGEITNHEIFAFIGELVTELDLFGLEKIAELMGALTYLFLNRKIFHADKAAMQQGYLHLIQHLSEIAKTYSRLSGIDDGVRAQLLAKVTAAKHFCRRVFQSEYDLDPSALLPDFVAATAQYLREFPLWWSDLEADQIKRRSFKVKVVMCGELIQFFPEQTANLHHFLQDLDELKGLRDYKAVTEFNIKIAAGIKQLGVLGSDAEPLLQDALGDFMVRATRVENFIALARDIIVGANSDTSEPAVTLEKLVALYTKESKTALQKVVTPLHNMLWRFAKFTEQDITIENIVKLRQWYYKLDNMLDKLCFLPSAGKLSLITAAAQKLNGSMEKIDGFMQGVKGIITGEANSKELLTVAITEIMGIATTGQGDVIEWLKRFYALVLQIRSALIAEPLELTVLESLQQQYKRQLLPAAFLSANDRSQLERHLERIVAPIIVERIEFRSEQEQRAERRARLSKVSSKLDLDTEFVRQTKALLQRYHEVANEQQPLSEYLQVWRDYAAIFGQEFTAPTELELHSHFVVIKSKLLIGLSEDRVVAAKYVLHKLEEQLWKDHVLLDFKANAKMVAVTQQAICELLENVRCELLTTIQVDQVFTILEAIYKQYSAYSAVSDAAAAKIKLAFKQFVSLQIREQQKDSAQAIVDSSRFLLFVPYFYSHNLAHEAEPMVQFCNNFLSELQTALEQGKESQSLQVSRLLLNMVLQHMPAPCFPSLWQDIQHAAQPAQPEVNVPGSLFHHKACGSNPGGCSGPGPGSGQALALALR